MLYSLCQKINTLKFKSVCRLPWDYEGNLHLLPGMSTVLIKEIIYLCLYKPKNLSILSTVEMATVNLRVLVEKFTPRIVYVKSGVDFYAQTWSFHQKSHH